MVAALNLVPPLARAWQVRGRVPWHAAAWKALQAQGVAVAVFVGALLVPSLARGEHAVSLEVAAVALLLVAVVAQQTLKSRRASLGPLDYNTLFHLLVSVALVVLLFGIRAAG
jgi:hypothetical protein